ncbi:MAG: UbiH/UbiF family hydroxylase [Betaproteobacteria bacterium]|nr:UbiH/UbiF family hydroxylase [Betaproteobacteria bacterium]
MTFDVAIVGGGLVGTALACALRGTTAALVSQERHAPEPPAGQFDSRIYAISPGNAAFLSGIEAWQRMPQARVTPVHAMRVFGDAGNSMIEFDAYRAGVSELAWIVEDGQLQAALWRGLQMQDRLATFAPADCERLEIADHGAVIELRDGRRIDARLVVGADGARSFVRAQAGIAANEQGYAQTAVVANFACERPHRNVAFQWFQGGAVLALLPLPGEHVSMVWSTGEEHAARLLALEPDALARAVATASRQALGEFSLVTRQRGFVLRRLSAERMVAPRVALAGDAAHVVHPLAGQGANLGFQDARELAAVLAAREPFRDPGDLRLLRRYERARAEAILAMRATVHGLFSLFDAKGAIAARLRNTGLNLADRLPVLKNVLMRQAMN